MENQNEDKLVLIFNKILKALHIKTSERINELLVQIFKFVIVGGIATVIDWAVYYVLYNFLNVPPLAANVFSFCVSVIYNYIMSIKWVFNVNQDKSKKLMFIEFISFSIIGLLISEFLLFVFINKIAINEMLSKVIATAIVMVFNFVTRKMFLEKRSKIK